jgi:hypothetical protein
MSNHTTHTPHHNANNTNPTMNVPIHDNRLTLTGLY